MDEGVRGKGEWTGGSWWLGVILCEGCNSLARVLERCGWGWPRTDELLLPTKAGQLTKYERGRFGGLCLVLYCRP